MKKFLLTTAAIIIFSSTSAAGRQNSIGMVTGAPTGTYIQFGRDIAAIMERHGIKIDVKPSNGSVDNIGMMTNPKENAALGIVQSDVLSILRRTRNPDSVAIAKRLRMVFPFYNEEVHILARKEIASLADLNGKKIVVGQKGSGNMLTANNIFSLAGIKPAELINNNPPEGVVAVLSGEADAVVYVGGKPVPLFNNLNNIKPVFHFHTINRDNFIAILHPLTDSSTVLTQL